MSIIFLNASIFSVPKGENRVANAGFYSALMKSDSTWVADLADEIPGIRVFSGNNYTLYAIHSYLVLKI